MFTWIALAIIIYVIMMFVLPIFFWLALITIIIALPLALYQDYMDKKNTGL